MSNEIDPPATDELIVRHAFYSKVSSCITTNSKDINSVANNLREFITDFETIKDEVQKTETRNKTIISIIAVVWTVMGGSVGLYIQKGLDNFEKQTQKISNIEIQMERTKTEFENYKLNIKRDFEDVKNLIPNSPNNRR